MIDLDKLEALAKAVPDGIWEETYELSERWRDILALVAEVRRLREAETMVLTYVSGLLSSNLERAGDATKSMTNYALDRVAKEQSC